MNYLILIIIGGLGVWLGFVLARRSRFIQKRSDWFQNAVPLGKIAGGALVAEQSKKKVENKEKILDFLRENKKVTNNNVEKLTGMSNATAERYLDDLEKEGKITQHGKIGQSVFYTLK